jgi:hypothetical protein
MLRLLVPLTNAAMGALSAGALASLSDVKELGAGFGA